ncbi:jg12299, partial [Pararge aegeria aegeria]
QLTWLVYIIGAAILGRASYNTSEENDAMDGELICRVLQLMDLTDSRLASAFLCLVIGLKCGWQLFRVSDIAIVGEVGNTTPWMDGNEECSSGRSFADFRLAF